MLTFSTVAHRLQRPGTLSVSTNEFQQPYICIAGSDHRLKLGFPVNKLILPTLTENNKPVVEKASSRALLVKLAANSFVFKTDNGFKAKWREPFCRNAYINQ
eukprot:Lankesteria_metandrocarpae@DN280_c0_g1_i1.p1